MKIIAKFLIILTSIAAIADMYLLSKQPTTLLIVLLPIQTLLLFLQFKLSGIKFFHQLEIGKLYIDETRENLFIVLLIMCYLTSAPFLLPIFSKFLER